MRAKPTPKKIRFTTDRLAFADIEGKRKPHIIDLHVSSSVTVCQVLIASGSTRSECEMLSTDVCQLCFQALHSYEVSSTRHVEIVEVEDEQSGSGSPS
jgi:hypothetical protein